MSFSPDEPSNVIFAERTWLQGAFLAGNVLGVELTLFFMAASLLVKQARRSDGAKRKRTIAMLTYCAVITLLGLLFYASNTQFTQLAFVDDRNFPGGPNAYEQAMFALPIDELGNVCAIMSTWMADALIVSTTSSTVSLLNKLPHRFGECILFTKVAGCIHI
jgi:hypothetical protein